MWSGKWMKWKNLIREELDWRKKVEKVKKENMKCMREIRTDTETEIERKRESEKDERELRVTSMEQIQSKEQHELPTFNKAIRIVIWGKHKIMQVAKRACKIRNWQITAFPTNMEVLRAKFVVRKKKLYLAKQSFLLFFLPLYKFSLWLFLSQIVIHSPENFPDVASNFVMYHDKGKVIRIPLKVATVIGHESLLKLSDEQRGEWGVLKKIPKVGNLYKRSVQNVQKRGLKSALVGTTDGR